MSASSLPRHVPRGSTGLSQHGDPVFPHDCPLNQHPARVRTRGTFLLGTARARLDIIGLGTALCCCITAGRWLGIGGLVLLNCQDQPTGPCLAPQYRRTTAGGLVLEGGGGGGLVWASLLRRKAPMTCHSRAFLSDFCFALLLCA